VLRTAFASELQPAARLNSTSCLGSPQSAVLAAWPCLPFSGSPISSGDSSVPATLAFTF